MSIGQWLLALTFVASALPNAAAAYQCSSTAFTYDCSGIDPAPDCPGRNAASYWGADAYTLGGAYVGAGGEESCTQGRYGSTHTRSMDATARQQTTRASFTWRHVDTYEPSFSTHCSMTLEVEYNALHRVESRGCSSPPPQPNHVLP